MHTYHLRTRISCCLLLAIVMFSCLVITSSKSLAQDSGYISKVMYLMQNGSWVEATKVSTALASSYPSDQSIYYLQGIAYYQLKDYNAARRSLSKSIALGRKKGDVYYYRGLIYLFMNQPKNALLDFDTALKDPKTPIQLDNLAKMLRARSDVKQWLSNIYHFRALANKGLGNYSAGLKDINRALELYPIESQYSRMARADLLFLSHDYTGAYTDYQKAINAGYPKALPNYNLAIIDFYFGNFKKAISRLNDILQFDPDYPNAKVELGLLHLFLGELDTAHTILQTVYQNNPTAYSSFQLAYLYHLQGKLKKATQYFSNALNLDPDYLQTVKIKYDLTPDSSPTKRILLDEITTAEYYLGIGVKTSFEPEEPIFKISKITFEPSAILTNISFTITISITADIIGDKINIPVEFFFTISQDDDILFTSEDRNITIINGQAGEWIENMNPVPVKGNFTLDVYARYKTHLAETHIDFEIK